MTDPKRFYSDSLDAAAKNRANHTGTQAIGTVSEPPRQGRFTRDEERDDER